MANDELMDRLNKQLDIAAELCATYIGRDMISVPLGFAGMGWHRQHEFLISKWREKLAEWADKGLPGTKEPTSIMAAKEESS